MALKDILVISGQGGLYRYVSKGKNHVIVENLSDGKRSTVSTASKISMLEDIAIFTEKEDAPLRTVFQKIQARENGGATISHKSPDAELKRYFESVLPQYDRERVYMSDIRKVLMWYNALRDLGVTDFEEAVPDNASPEAATEAAGE
ncbi:MAG: DUF5606 domain-containing protein [Bacteroidales bacterium]|jgi:hypothetical protein|nr:DUF5606 domain-containing protein [Bacteroidales bacterium]